MEINRKQILENLNVRKIKSVAQKIDPKAEIVLYSSRTRGDSHAFSDWDLLILTSYESSIIDE